MSLGLMQQGSLTGEKKGTGSVCTRAELLCC
jgi:hypothetical protein